ncbi:MAG: D-alanine--poly(phosphoribitol) ligase subunit 2 [Lachnospiraceae bacterium]|nr:D-alanine--poly(phosphoribitol) ligase subunit 2 [Lachnospiraceae bacterium]
MIDVRAMLFEICEDERVFEKDIDLIESGILDSLAFIELFCFLEDHGIDLQPTQVSRESLRTPEAIEKLIHEHL